MVGWFHSWFVVTLERLKINKNIKPTKNYVLYTAKLNQDCLENLFCTLRQQNGITLIQLLINFCLYLKKCSYLIIFNTQKKQIS